MHIQYCSKSKVLGHNYRELITQLEMLLRKDEKLGHLIQYQLLKDEKKTGNFEINCYTTEDLSDIPYLVWSTQLEGRRIVPTNNKTLMNQLKEAMTRFVEANNISAPRPIEKRDPADPLTKI